MAEFVVHSIPGSPFGHAVCATLQEKGADWCLAALAPRDIKQAPHIERHPFGRVPVLEHDGFMLYETQAILRYLDRVRPNPALTPSDPRQAARMDQIIGLNDWYLFPGAASVIVFHRVIAPRLFGGTPDEAVIAAALPKTRLVLAELSRLLGAQEFLAGAALSLADLHLAPQLALLAEAPEWAELSMPHPNLVDWLGRMLARKSIASTGWAELTAMAQG